MLLEKPIALELYEADELIAIAKRNHVKFTIGYSQRFNPRDAKWVFDDPSGNTANGFIRVVAKDLSPTYPGRVREVVLGATRVLGARRMIPMHWGTFDLADDAVDEPPRALERLLAKPDNGDLARRVATMAVGERLAIG